LDAPALPSASAHSSSASLRGLAGGAREASHASLASLVCEGRVTPPRARSSTLPLTLAGGGVVAVEVDPTLAPHPARPPPTAGGPLSSPPAPLPSPSSRALELDLPVLGASHYARCIICLEYGHCAPLVCCAAPRHAACEAAFQAGHMERWVWEAGDPRASGAGPAAGRVVMPCSTCRKPWYRACPTDALFRSVCAHAGRVGVRSQPSAQ